MGQNEKALYGYLQSTARKMMAGVHFTTIPCEPNTANRLKESHVFCTIRPSGNNRQQGIFILSAICTYVVSVTTLLGSLWPNISTPRVTVFQISGCGVCSYAMEQTSSASSMRWGCFSNLELFNRKDLTSILTIFELQLLMHESATQIHMRACVR